MKKQTDKELQEKELNPEGGQQVKTYSEEEYKNAQAFGTKAQQEKIALAEKLVKNNPKELETMDDISLVNKVVGNLYGAETLDELKILNPELFTDGGEGEGDEDELSKLQQKVKVMEYKSSKGMLNTALDAIVVANKDLSDTIPNFKEKMLEEIKFISSDMTIQDRVEKTFKLVAGTNSGQDAYLALQGKTVVKTKQAEPTTKVENLKSQLKDIIKL